jgi:hypothetical protein
MNRLPSDQVPSEGNSQKVLLTGSVLVSSPWVREFCQQRLLNR